MLTELPTDVALSILDLLPTKERVKLAVQSQGWRDLSVENLRRVVVTIEDGWSDLRFEGFRRWMTKYGANAKVASDVHHMALDATYAEAFTNEKNSIVVQTYEHPGRHS